LIYTANNFQPAKF